MPEKKFIDADDLYPNLSKRVYWEYNRGARHKITKKYKPFDWSYDIQISEDSGFGLPERDYFVDAEGVSIYFEDGRTILTQMTPRIMFPDSTYGLSEKELVYILSQPIEGTEFAKEQMDLLYGEYLKAEKRFDNQTN